MKRIYSKDRRFMQSYGRWLIKHGSGDDDYHQVWTPLRFVSSEEVKTFGREYFKEEKFIYVQRRNHPGAFDIIYSYNEGHYRVSVRTHGQYHSECANGFPSGRNNYIYKSFKDKYHENIDKGKHIAHVKNLKKRILEKRKSSFANEKIESEVSSFFSILAISSELKIAK